MEDTQTTPDDQQIPEDAISIETTTHPADEQSFVSFLDAEEARLDDPIAWMS